MKKSNSRLLEIMIVVFISCLIGVISGSTFIYSLDIFKNNGNISISKIEEIDELYNKIINEYYGKVDENQLIDAALDGMLSVLDDYSSYMDQSDSISFNNKMKGEYYGIGIEALTLSGEGVLVVSVVENSPADSVGIKEGDIIKKVNNDDLTIKDASYFTSLVSITKDELKLEIKREERILNISVKPEKVIIKSVTSNKFNVSNKKMGYLKIKIFAANTATQFATELKKLEEEGIDSLIIDVRDNTGGYLSSVTTILEMFMEKDSILYKTESKTVTSIRKDNTEESRDYPVSVLVNASSASASEVLAACFKENKNSDIVGNATYGKGTVQEIVEISEETQAKITTKKWLTPNGNWVEKTGVEPTIRVNIGDKYLQTPTLDNDNQLNSAINSIINKK